MARQGLEQTARCQWRAAQLRGAQAGQCIVDRPKDDRRRRDGAPLAHALGAEFGMRRGRFEVLDPHVRHLGGAWHHVIGQCRGQGLAKRIVGHFFVKRGADALGDATDRLAFHHHRIDHDAAILDGHVVEDLDRTEVRVNRDHRRVRCVGKGARVDPGLVAHRGLEACGIDVCGKQLRAEIPGLGDLPDRHRFATASHVTVRE